MYIKITAGQINYFSVYWQKVTKFLPTISILGVHTHTYSLSSHTLSLSLALLTHTLSLSLSSHTLSLSLSSYTHSLYYTATLCHLVLFVCIHRATLLLPHLWPQWRTCLTFFSVQWPGCYNYGLHTTCSCHLPEDPRLVYTWKREKISYCLPLNEQRLVRLWLGWVLTVVHKHPVGDVLWVCGVV